MLERQSYHALYRGIHIGTVADLRGGGGLGGTCPPLAQTLMIFIYIAVG